MKPMSESVISKVGFWQGLVVSAISIVITLATIFIVAGGSMQRLSQVEKDAQKNATEIQNVKADIDGRLQRIEEKMVNKEDFRELKSDVKDLLKRGK